MTSDQMIATPPEPYLAVRLNGRVLTEIGARPMSQSIHIPTTRTHRRDECGDRSPSGWHCNRPAGHGGRHLFARRHTDGKVREVWA